MKATVLSIFAVTGLALATTQETIGQDEEEKKLSWSNVADLGLVVTGGNSSTSTFTFNDKLTRTWENATLLFDVGGLRTNTTDDRFAVVTGTDEFTVVEDLERDLDTERYHVQASYRRDVNEKIYWIAGARWMRDLNAGIEDMATVFGGLGNTWWNREDSHLLTDYSLTYTNRQEEIPTLDDQFAALRIAADSMKQFGSNKNHQFDSDFTCLPNLNDLEDYRFDWTNSLTSNLTSLFALRVSLDLLYRNIPSLKEIDLYLVPPTEPASVIIGSVPVHRKKLDTLFKVTLVVTL